jgi:polyprenyl P-hydroxybenzoate/phenylacrylic acid decarboxylase-like protein
MTGATGAIYGVRILEVLRNYSQWESHLVISSAGLVNLKHELGMSRKTLYDLADTAYHIDEIAACIASGSFKTEGMIIAPCSMKTLASVAYGFGDNLISRAADVVLKERRQLLLVPRETPLNLAHIRNMGSVTEMGGIIFPPMPAFYNKDDSVKAFVDEGVGRILAIFGLETELLQEWQGVKSIN